MERTEGVARWDGAFQRMRRARRYQHIAYDLYTDAGLTRSLTFP